MEYLKKQSINSGISSNFRKSKITDIPKLLGNGISEVSNTKLAN